MWFTIYYGMLCAFFGAWSNDIYRDWKVRRAFPYRWSCPWCTFSVKCEDEKTCVSLKYTHAKNFHGQLI